MRVDTLMPKINGKYETYNDNESVKPTINPFFRSTTNESSAPKPYWYIAFVLPTIMLLFNGIIQLNKTSFYGENGEHIPNILQYAPVNTENEQEVATYLAYELYYQFGALGVYHNPLELFINIWRIPVTLFIHADTNHLMTNVVMLLIIWLIAQRHMRNGMLLLLFSVTGILSAITFELTTGADERTILIGASCSIYAIVLCTFTYFTLNLRNKENGVKLTSITYFVTALLTLTIIVDIIENPNIHTNISHATGIVTGVIFGIIVYLKQRKPTAKNKK